MSLMILAACGDPNPGVDQRRVPPQRTPSPSSQETYCFQGISGSGNRDTTTVRMDLRGTELSGTMEVVLHEKDRRNGRFKGTIDPDSVIRAEYRFMQEGMQDTIPIQFRLTPDALMQRRAAYDPASGREYPDSASAFGSPLSRVPCME